MKKTSTALIGSSLAVASLVAATDHVPSRRESSAHQNEINSNVNIVIIGEDNDPDSQAIKARDMITRLLGWDSPKPLSSPAAKALADEGQQTNPKLKESVVSSKSTAPKVVNSKVEEKSVASPEAMDKNSVVEEPVAEEKPVAEPTATNVAEASVAPQVPSLLQTWKNKSVRQFNDLFSRNERHQSPPAEEMVTTNIVIPSDDAVEIDNTKVARKAESDTIDTKKVATADTHKKTETPAVPPTESQAESNSRPFGQLIRDKALAMWDSLLALLHIGKSSPSITEMPVVAQQDKTIDPDEARKNKTEGFENTPIEPLIYENDKAVAVDSSKGSTPEEKVESTPVETQKTTPEKESPSIEKPVSKNYVHLVRDKAKAMWEALLTLLHIKPSATPPSEVVPVENIAEVAPKDPSLSRKGKKEDFEEAPMENLSYGEELAEAPAEVQTPVEPSVKTEAVATAPTTNGESRNFAHMVRDKAKAIWQSLLALLHLSKTAPPAEEMAVVATEPEKATTSEKTITTETEPTLAEQTPTANTENKIEAEQVVIEERPELDNNMMGPRRSLLSQNTSVPLDILQYPNDLVTEFKNHITGGFSSYTPKAKVHIQEDSIAVVANVKGETHGPFENPGQYEINNAKTGLLMPLGESNRLSTTDYPVQLILKRPTLLSVDSKTELRIQKVLDIHEIILTQGRVRVKLLDQSGLWTVRGRDMSLSLSEHADVTVDMTGDLISRIFILEGEAYCMPREGEMPIQLKKGEHLSIGMGESHKSDISESTTQYLKSHLGFAEVEEYAKKMMAAESFLQRGDFNWPLDGKVYSGVLCVECGYAFDQRQKAFDTCPHCHEPLVIKAPKKVETQPEPMGVKVEDSRWILGAAQAPRQFGD